MTSQTFIEMRWRCGACSIENLGRHDDCQTCRKRREAEPYYDAPDSEPLSREEVLADAALSAEAFEDPDWRCNRCGTSQDRASQQCTECGADQTVATSMDGTEPLAPPVEIELPSRFVIGDPVERDREVAFEPPKKMNPLVKELIWGGVLFVAIVALGVGGWFFLR